MVTAAALVMLFVMPTMALPTGGRQSAELSFTTTQPGAPTGFDYSASFRDPEDPGGDPPPLRRLVIKAPEGASIDTGVVEQCEASDSELRERGQAACPAASRIGAGMALVKPVLLPDVQYRATLFNADHDQLELLEGDPPAPSVVVHGFVRGDLIDSPIPTCLNGGYVPDDCPSDQAALRGNALSVPAVTAGTGNATRTYMRTPPLCPRSGAWQTPITFYYGDGVTDTLVTEQPCRRPTLSVRVRPPRRPRARRLRRLQVTLLAEGSPRVEGVRVAVRRVRRDGRLGRVLGRLPRQTTVTGRRRAALRLRRRGLRARRYEIAVRGRGVDRVVRRFRIR